MPKSELTSRIDDAKDEAQDAFWQVVTKHFPEIKRGDFSIADTFAFGNACEQAITNWVKANG